VREQVDVASFLADVQAASGGGLVIVGDAETIAGWERDAAPLKVFRLRLSPQEQDLKLAGMQLLLEPLASDFDAAALADAAPSVVADRALRALDRMPTSGAVFAIDGAQFLDTPSAKALEALARKVCDRRIGFLAFSSSDRPVEYLSWRRLDLAARESARDSATVRAENWRLAQLAAESGDQLTAARHRMRAATGPSAAAAADAESVAVSDRASGDHASAADAFQVAASLTPDREGQARRLVLAAEEYWNAGKSDLARDLLRAARVLDPGPVVQARGSLLQGSIAFARGDMGEAYRDFMSSARVTVDSDGDIAVAAGALLRAAEVAWWSGRRDRAAEVVVAAESLSSDGSDSAAFVIAVLVGGDHSLAGRHLDAGPHLRHALRLADELHGPRIALLAAQAALLAGEDRAAESLHRRAIEELRETRAIGELPFALQSLASVEIWRGDLSAATGYLAESQQVDGVDSEHDAVPPSIRAHVAALRGDAEACRRYVADTMGAADDDVFPTAAASALWALGVLELGLGNPDAALTHLLTVAEGASEYGQPLVSLFSAPDLVEAAVRSGRPEISVAAHRAFDEWAAAGGRWPAVVAPRLRALLASPSDADEYYALAADGAEQADLPLEEGRARLLFGEHLLRTRRRVDARNQLRRALELFEVVGAQRWVERTKKELSATGETARRRDGAEESSLTPRERQIAELVAGGASNHEVATRLFLSRKTVEYHLHKAYTKLGIGSRSQIASALGEQ
jgi:DNA-binding CsgD family transcriptional regulator